MRALLELTGRTFSHGRRAGIGVDLGHASFGFRPGLSWRNVLAGLGLRSRTNGKTARFSGKCRKLCGPCSFVRDDRSDHTKRHSVGRSGANAQRRHDERRYGARGPSLERRNSKGNQRQYGALRRVLHAWRGQKRQARRNGDNQGGGWSARYDQGHHGGEVDHQERQSEYVCRGCIQNGEVSAAQRWRGDHHLSDDVWRRNGLQEVINTSALERASAIRRYGHRDGVCRRYGIVL